MASTYREGSLEAPTRHALDWKSAAFYQREAVDHELKRVFDICHGCRRCVSLCNAFPTLFDLIDQSATMDVEGVSANDYSQIVDQCYLCDLCYLTKCPYVPPHEWNVDFPHLMLRAKAVQFNEKGARVRDKILSATDRMGALASIPIVVNVVNYANQRSWFRRILEKVLGVHRASKLPSYHRRTFRKRFKKQDAAHHRVSLAGKTRGKVVLYTTCYGNYNEPELNADLQRVLEHNGIEVALLKAERCCGMPKLELGDLESVASLKEHNIPNLVRWVDEGWDILAPVPSCVLMYKQELPLLFPDDPEVLRVKEHIFDPFEYLAIRHRHGQLNTQFVRSLGKVAYHVACHQRVQRIGLKTKEILSLIPDTQVTAIERCSGHDGTYGVKKEFYPLAAKIGQPVATRILEAAADFYTSDCPMAGRHLEHLLDNQTQTHHPIALLRLAYGL